MTPTQRPSTTVNIQLYRYGEGAHLRGICLGVTRFPPRGVRRDTWSERGLCDVWLPNLAPSPELVAAFRGGKISFSTFATRYRREMRAPEARHLIELIAGIARLQPVNLGCVCADPTRCHRSLLGKLVEQAQAGLHWRDSLATAAPDAPRPFASPPCDMPEIVDD